MTTMQRLRPSQVLGVQAELRERFTKPSPYLKHWLQEMARSMDASSAFRRQLMFYPYEPHLDEAHAGLFAQSLGRGLFSAETYQITDHMVGILEDLYWNTVKKGGAEAVEEELLPSKAGFIWYDRPVELRERTGGVVSIRAVSWNPQVFYYAQTDGFGRASIPVVRDGVRLSFWQLRGDPTDWSEVMDSEASRQGDLLLQHTVALSFGERYPVQAITDSAGDSIKGNSVLHWAIVTWMLLDTEIAAEQRQRPEQHSRRARQVARSLKHNEVRVITLRRSSKPQDADHVVQHRDVDWTCCWVVDGFWRHIESYDEDQFKKGHQARTDKGTSPRCTVCGAKITRVKSHIRGPDWKPLRNPDRLYLLKR
jgi:hypothetical protein